MIARIAKGFSTLVDHIVAIQVLELDIAWQGLIGCRNFNQTLIGMRINIILVYKIAIIYKTPDLSYLHTRVIGGNEVKWVIESLDGRLAVGQRKPEIVANGFAGVDLISPTYR
ncbi:hypothetical protein D3C86_1857240 [compost metagenome]